VKSPYLADVRLTQPAETNSQQETASDADSTNSDITICHAPSLSCGGLVESGRHVRAAELTRQSRANVNRHSTHRIVMATDTTPNECQVGVDPLLPNSIANELLVRYGCQLGASPHRSNADISSADQTHQAEVTLGDCRFDFVSTFLSNAAHKSAVVTEVKSVPLTNVSLTKRRTAASSKPIGLFPWIPQYEQHKRVRCKRYVSRADAQRQLKASARLCKHLAQLAALGRASSSDSTHNATESPAPTVLVAGELHSIVGRQVLFVASRPDVSGIMLATQDNPALTDSVASAVSAGVRLLGCSTSWDSAGIAFEKWLPVFTDGPSAHSRFAALSRGVASGDGPAAEPLPEPWRVIETHQLAEGHRLVSLGGSSASVGVSAFKWTEQGESAASTAGTQLAGVGAAQLDGEKELVERLKGQVLMSSAAVAFFAQGPTSTSCEIQHDASPYELLQR